MKSCLDLSSGAADNSSKPIILSLTAALFVVRPAFLSLPRRPSGPRTDAPLPLARRQNTREKQSVVMLETALQMARSLGPDGAGGNAALGAWLGEKYEGALQPLLSSRSPSGRLLTCALSVAASRQAQERRARQGRRDG